MAKIIILRGNSGSGKTTVAKLLQRKFGRGTLLISQDVVRREMLIVRDGPGNKSIGLMRELVLFASENCDIAILEGILYAEWYTELFRLIEEIYGNQIYAYYFELTFEETLRRHALKPNAKDFGEREMRDWWKESDYLSNVTGIREKILDEKMSADAIAEHIYQNATGL